MDITRDKILHISSSHPLLLCILCISLSPSSDLKFLILFAASSADRPFQHRTLPLRLPQPAARKRRSLPSGRLGAFLTTSRREVPPAGRSAEATRAKPSRRGDRRPVYGSTGRQGRLGCTVTSEEKYPLA
ncbi:hypothetical protein HMPREF1986_02328 [Oribacterium sp. oral taxon 078 str. F0263]|nr:hypothetical protein HMPREF1986_02328 [Oribacterium sp. oral taxon 078 str. F0263]